MSDYPSCERTYLTLRIYSETLAPDEITDRLGVQPSRTQSVGARRTSKEKVKLNGWFLCSKSVVKSKDSRKHVDWLEDQLEGKSKKLRKLVKRGCSVDITCLWLPKGADGGPTLSKKQISFLADLGVDFWYDFHSVDVLEKVLAMAAQHGRSRDA